MKPRRPSEVKPGDLCDRKGTPIYPGDLIRTDHFKDRRGRRYYLWHAVTVRDGVLYLTPVHQLATGIKDGGECYLHTIADKDGFLPESDVMDGGCFTKGVPCPENRPRMKRGNVATEV